MKRSSEDVTTLDLQDYLDGRLSAKRRVEVEAFLERNPESAAEVVALRAQSMALRRLGAEILDEPVPDRLMDLVRRLP
jgi:anti-sigma factor RsiW